MTLMLLLSLLSLLLLLLLPSLTWSVSDNIACDSHVQTNVCLPRNYSSMDIPLVDSPNKVSSVAVDGCALAVARHSAQD